MLKLYRTANGLTEYWEAWEDTPTKVIVHWGRLGEKGETRTVPHKSSVDSSAVIEREAEPVRADGFGPIGVEEHAQVVIQYKLNGDGSRKDFERCVKVEELMNEALGWTGLGHCDGNDFGSGTVNIFCEVVDGAKAESIVISALKEHNFLDESVLARRSRLTDDEYVVFWPDNYADEFSLLEP